MTSGMREALASAADTPARPGKWMQTYTGKAFWPLDPRPEEVEPLDIAHALGMLCRYNGHSNCFYSVAEHCVLMSETVTPGNALWALLHDATEAYVGDMIRPLKQMMPAYAAAEDRLMDAICRRFGISSEPPHEVKTADKQILLNERAVLMGPSPFPWDVTDGLDPLPISLRLWSPAEASDAYSARLRDLTT